MKAADKQAAPGAQAALRSLCSPGSPLAAQEHVCVCCGALPQGAKPDSGAAITLTIRKGLSTATDSS